VSLVFGCGVLMEQNRWFFGFWVSFPICSFVKRPTTLIVVVVVCVMHFGGGVGEGEGRVFDTA